MANVRLTNVNKIYPGEVTAVKDVNLDIQHGEFLVLVGPSGCGKSTTLRMVAGLEDISKGEVRIGDRVVNDVPPKDRDIAMVFQNYALYPHMTVYENMAFGLKLRKFKKDEIDRRVRAASDTLELTPYLERRPKALSGGQRQRVAMGRAIVREPAVFLFDEPLSNLDAKMRVEMRREILQLHRRIKTTMIYVTHDQVEAMTLGDRICVMRDGLIEQVGSPTEVFDHPASLFVARFIGTPPMNIFDGRLLRQDRSLVFDGGTFQVPVDPSQHEKVAGRVGQPIQMGIRPRALVLSGDSAVDPAAAITGQVEIAEMLGEEVLAHVRSGVHRFTLSVGTHSGVDAEQSINVYPVMRYAHFFDPETGRNLTMPTPSAATRPVTC
ncbi:MAG TPA: glycerol-3-phosphate ABC transporter ATP-binding protein [Verrucomicrobia bacterium]|nr:glycerol-3-phosphate ABC transporter ATP-binding protein [Verrucomicrobiota bacterium]